MNKYTRLRKIGKGNFGDVWLVQDNQGKEFALKRIDLLFQTVDPQNEVELLKVLKHPNIIKYYDSFIHNDKLCILMEYAEHSDLAVYTKDNQPNILNWLTQLLLAVQYLHNQNVVHRDIKLRNVFLTKDGIIKLGDFSISKKLDNLLTNTSLGTPFYLSPEMCESKPHNNKTDIWSIGCFLYELCTKQKPFNGDSIPAIINNILRAETPRLPPHHPQIFQDIINSCLIKDPVLRPTIRQLLSIPEINQERIKIQQEFRDKGIIQQPKVFVIECPQFEDKQKIDKPQVDKCKAKQQYQQQLTPQCRQGQLSLTQLFSECTSPNKKPYKKAITINTALDDKIDEEDITQKKPSFAKMLFNPKTPTSPNRNVLLADFLKNKLGIETFAKIKNILENSSDPLKLLDHREQVAEIIGEQNIDCIKILKLLIGNSITPPSSHFRTMSAYQFINQRNKTASHQLNSDYDVRTNAWDEKF